MHAVGEPRSWPVNARPYRAAVLALSLLVAIAATCEIAARTDAAKRLLTLPSYGTRIRFFDAQMARLDALVRTQGPVDCALLGSSAALQALDPQAFSETYA